jgi:hypothetical protein
LFRLLNTRESTSDPTRQEKFVSGVNAAAKRPLDDNKRGNKPEQSKGAIADVGAALMAALCLTAGGRPPPGRLRPYGAEKFESWREPQSKAPGAMTRPGAAREFQFPEYTDLVDASSKNKVPRGAD